MDISYYVTIALAIGFFAGFVTCDVTIGKGKKR